MRILILLILMFISCGSETAFGSVSFELPVANSIEGETLILKSKDIETKATVIEFMAWFCGACHKNESNVESLAYEYKDSIDVIFIDVSIDKKIEDVGKWLVKYQPQRFILWDKDRSLFAQSGKKLFIPKVIVLDSCMNIVYSHVGIWDSPTEHAIRNKISQVIRKDYKCKD